jgi:hypothetical protein
LINKLDHRIIPKLTHLFLNVVIFVGYNILTTFETKCKTIFAKCRDNGLNFPNFKTETSLVEIRIILMSFFMARTDPKDSHHAPFFFRRKVTECSLTQFVIASSRDRR